MTNRRLAALAAMIIFSALAALAAPAAAAVPSLLSYQGTLRNNGALVSGNVAMEFRITSADGAVTYWASGSTTVPVSVGLFRYTLGSPNEAQFAAIPWKDITPYVQMLVEGNAFPREPLFASAYAQHAQTAERSTGTFTAYDGDIRISTSAGSRGLVFQDGTAQYSAAGWTVSGLNAVLTVPGGAGIGVAAPQARLDVQAASPAAFTQAWRDSSGVVRSSLSASGYLYGPGLQLNDTDANSASSGVRFYNFSCSGTSKLTVDASGNLVCASDQTGSGTGNLIDTLSDTLAAGNNAGALGIVNLGSVALGHGTPATRLDVQAVADGSVQYWRDDSGAIVSSMNAAGMLFADASGLRNLPRGADSLGSHTATATLNMAGFGIAGAGEVAASTLTASQLLISPALAMNAFVQMSAAGPANNGGVYVSSNVSAAGGFFGSGSGLTGLNAASLASGLVPDARLSSNVALRGGAQTFTGDNAFSGALTVASSFTVTGSTGAALARVQFAPGVYISSSAPAFNYGVYVSSHLFVVGVASATRYYGDGSALTGVVSNVVDTLSSTLGAGNDASGFDIVNTGSLAVGRSPAVARLDVQSFGSDLQFWRSGAGTVVSSMSSAGVIYADGSALRNMGAYPRLAADQTFSGANTFTGAGQFIAQSPSAPGLYVSSGLVVANGSLGVGTASPQQRLDVSGGVRIGDTSAAYPGTIRFNGSAFQGHTGAGWTELGGSMVYDNTALWAVGPTTVYTAGSSSNVAIGTSNSDFSKLLVRGAGNTQATNSLLAENSDAVRLFAVRNDGNVAVGPVASPAARLDVQSAAAGYAQIWRDQFGTEIASMTSSGQFYADAANLRNLPGGADGLGSHTASQDLEMSNYRVKNASALNLRAKVELSSTTAANYGGVYVSTHVYLPAGAKYYGDGSALTGISGSDNLGNHVMSQNLVSGTRWLSGDGDNEGLYVGGTGNVGVGSSSPQEKLEVAGGVRVGDSAGTSAGTIRFNGTSFQGYTGTVWTALGGSMVVDNTALWAVGPTTVYTVGSSSNVAIGTSNSASSKLLVRGAGNTSGTSALRAENSDSAQLLLVRNDGNVAVGPVASPAARLDVQGAAAGYAQVWRNSAGVEVASITTAGQFYADAANLRNMPTGADSLGSHTASQDLEMSNYRVKNASALNLRAKVELSSTTAANYGGVYVSTHVYLPAGAKYYGDGSALTGVVSNVVDTLSATLVAGNDAGANAILNTGSVAVGRSAASARLDVQASGTDVQFWRDNGGTVVSSVTSAGVIYADGSGLRNVGRLSSTQTFTGGNTFSGAGQFTAQSASTPGLYVSSGLVVANGSLGVGTATPQQKLDVSGGVKIGDTTAAYPGTIRFNGSSFQGHTGAGWTGLGGSLVYDSTAAWAIGPTTVFLVGESSNVAIGAGNSDFSKLLVHGSGNSPSSNALLAENSDSTQLLLVRNDGNVAVGDNANPAAKLDVQGTLGGYAQIWRNSSGVEVASITTAGQLYADAASLRNLPTGADSLGSHTASQDLEMSNYRVKSASALNLRPKVELSSTTAANYGGLYISTHVYLPAGARYYGDGSGLTGVGGSDNLGSHIMSQSLVTAAHWLSGDGDNEGLFVGGTGNVGVGSSSPQEKLEVAGGIRVGDSAGTSAGTIRFNGGSFQGYTGSAWTALGGSMVVDNTSLWAVGPTTVYTVGSSSNVAIGTSNSASSKLLVRGAGNTSGTNALLAENSDSAQLLLVRNDGNVAVGPVASPAARLDVQGAAAGYAQVWRDSSGVEIASITTAGQFYADAANLRNLPSGADSLGSHTASQDLEMSNYRVKNASALNLRAKVELSSTTAANYGGVYISTHVYLPAGAKYYGDGSGLTGVGGADNLGNHTASANLNMGGFSVMAVSTITVSSLTATGAGVTVSTHLLVMNGDIVSYELSGSGDQCVYADNSGVLHISGAGPCGNASGLDNLGNHTMQANLRTNGNWISGDGGNEGISVSAVGNTGLGIGAPVARLDVQPSDSNAQYWRDTGGVVVASMSASGVLYAEASGLRNLPAKNVNLVLLAGNNAGGVALLNTGNIGVNRAAAAVSLDVQTAAAGTMAQYWRNTGGTVVSSMSSAGVLYAGGSGLRGLSLAQVLGGNNNAAGFGIANLSSITVVGTGTGAPLDARPHGTAEYVQIWRNSAGLEIASVSASGFLYADGSQLVNLPVGGLATRPLNMGFLNITNVAALTANDHLTVYNSPLTVYSSGTFTGAQGVGAVKLAMADGLEISTTSVGFHGGIGVRVSTNVFIVGIASATKFYGDGSALTNLPGGGGGNVVDTLSDTLTAGNNAGGNSITNLAGVTVLGAAGVTSPSLNLAANVQVSTTTAGNRGGVYISSHVVLASGAKFYGDGSGLTNLPGSGGTVTNPLGADLDANTYDLLNVSTISAASVLRINGSIKAAVLAGSGNRCVYVDSNGVLQAKTEDCGTGGGGGGAESCVNPNDASDILVAVGDFCVDKYEATVWSLPNGGTKYGTGVDPDNYPCSKNGQNCSTAGTKIYARSLPSEVPSSSMTWFQANAACVNAGKHLITNAEWQAAVIGTPDPGDRGGPPGAITPSNPPNCNAGTSGPTTTGGGTSCLSAFGAENMVGSLWEWVSDWGQYASQQIFWPAVGGATYHDDVAQGGVPGPTTAIGGMIRGGAYDSIYTVAGPYAFSTLIPPYGSSATLGFRCAMRLR